MFHMTRTTASPLENGGLLSKGKLKDKGQRRQEDRDHSKGLRIERISP